MSPFNFSSKHLSHSHLKGLQKVGDILLPGDEDMPSFSETECIKHVDRIFDYLYEDDIGGVKILLTLFGLLPKSLAAGLLGLTENDRGRPGPIASVYRMINLGLKGIVFTLYYSDLEKGEIHQRMKWDVQVNEAVRV